MNEVDHSGDKTEPSVTMKFSSSILVVGCCLMGQWWIVAGKVFERPSIQISPSSVVSFGGSFNITCNVKNATISRNAQFTLYKKDKASWITLIMWKNKKKALNVYFKHNAKPQDGGTYKCSYCLCQIFSQTCSMDSDPVDVFIREPGLWKPSIKIRNSVTPYVNKNATIVCKGMTYDLNFTLHRFGSQISVPESEDRNDTAKFTFSPLKAKDGGIYTCEYRQQKNKFVLSMTSDPLELNLTDSSLVKPTIELRTKEYPDLGKSATIVCRGPETGLNFSLQGPSNSTSHWLSESLENTTKFFSAQVRLEDEGNYTCRYHHKHHPFVWSEPSEPVLLVVKALPIVEVSVRMVVAILVLLATTLIAAEAIYSSKKEKEKKKKVTLTSPPE